MYWFFLGNSEKKYSYYQNGKFSSNSLNIVQKNLKSLHVINWLRRKKRESLIYIYSNAKY